MRPACTEAVEVMISQFFVLSQRGDNIVFRDCKARSLSHRRTFPLRFYVLLHFGCGSEAVWSNVFSELPYESRFQVFMFWFKCFWIFVYLADPIWAYFELNSTYTSRSYLYSGLVLISSLENSRKMKILVSSSQYVKIDILMS